MDVSRAGKVPINDGIWPPLRAVLYRRKYLKTKVVSPAPLAVGTIRDVFNNRLFGALTLTARPYLRYNRRPFFTVTPGTLHDPTGR